MHRLLVCVQGLAYHVIAIAPLIEQELAIAEMGNAYHAANSSSLDADDSLVLPPRFYPPEQRQWVFLPSNEGLLPDGASVVAHEYARPARTPRTLNPSHATHHSHRPQSPTTITTTSHGRYICSIYWALIAMTNLKGLSAHESRQCYVLSTEVLQPMSERLLTMSAFIFGALGAAHTVHTLSCHSICRVHSSHRRVCASLCVRSRRDGLCVHLRADLVVSADPRWRRHALPHADGKCMQTPLTHEVARFARVLAAPLGPLLAICSRPRVL